MRQEDVTDRGQLELCQDHLTSYAVAAVDYVRSIVDDDDLRAC